MAKQQKLQIDPSDTTFGAVLNCAVRYAVGRQAYMPSVVIDFIRPLLPHLNLTTLWVFHQDILRAKSDGLGDPLIDAPLWLRFHENVKAEIARRESGGRS